MDFKDVHALPQPNTSGNYSVEYMFIFMTKLKKNPAPCSPKKTKPDIVPAVTSRSRCITIEFKVQSNKQSACWQWRPGNSFIVSIKCKSVIVLVEVFKKRNCKVINDDRNAIISSILLHHRRALSWNGTSRVSPTSQPQTSSLTTRRICGASWCLLAGTSPVTPTQSSHI